MIRCACLAYMKNNQVFLVRDKNETLWHFPGANVKSKESPISALVRALETDFLTSISPQDLSWLIEVVTLTKNQSDWLQLIVYGISELPPLVAQEKTEEMGWFDFTDEEMMAPAVVKALRMMSHKDKYVTPSYSI